MKLVQVLFILMIISLSHQRPQAEPQETTTALPTLEPTTTTPPTTKTATELKLPGIPKAVEMLGGLLKLPA